HPDSQAARQAGLVSYANATFTDLLSWLPTRPTRDTLPSRTTDTQDVLLHDTNSNSYLKLKLEGYSNTSFGNDIDIRRSTCGYIFTLGLGPVSFKSGL
ncbi:hypothetical protein M433DRAFT_248351, partial [Acidomyces richmondensis BFW]